MNTSYDYIGVPDNQGDYFINPCKGFFSIVRPFFKDVTNYIANPSFEARNTAYWHPDPLTNNAGIVIVNRVTADQDRAFSGLSSASVTQIAPGLDYGVMYSPSNFADIGGTIPIASGGKIYLSAYVKACAGDQITITGNYDGVQAPTVPDFVARSETYTATGRWQRISVMVTNQRPSATLVNLRIIVKPFTTCTNFLLDAVTASDVQLSDYFDGSSSGATWSGAPFTSSSTISRFERLIGEEIFLKDVGFQLISYTGHGMPPIINDTIPYAQGGGAYYNRTWPDTRTITLVGNIGSCRGIKDLHKQHSRLIDLVGLLRNYIDPQPILLRYRLTKCYCDVTGVLEIPVVYKAGLEGNINILHQEKITLQFEAFEELYWRTAEVKTVRLFQNTSEIVCYRGTAPTPIQIFIEGANNGVNTADFLNVQNLSLGSGIYMANSPNAFRAINNTDYLYIGGIDQICGSALLVNKTTGAIGNATGDITRPASVPSEFVLLNGDNELIANFDAHTGINPVIYASYRERFLSATDVWRIEPNDRDCVRPGVVNILDRC